MAGLIDLCSTFAPLITEVAEYTFDTCMIDLILLYNFGHEVNDMAYAALAENDNPYLDRSRLFDHSWRLAAEPEMRAYLQDEGSDDVGVAQEYLSRFNDYNGHQGVAYGVIMRAKAAARIALEFDPYNPELIDLILLRTPVSTDRATMPRRAELRDLLQRRLTAAPYDAGTWAKLAKAQEMPEDSNALTVQDPYWVNAIAYSNQDTEQVYGFLKFKLDQRAALDATLLASLDPAQIDAALTCPIVRLSRLFDGLCLYVPAHWGCRRMMETQTVTQAVLADASERGVCTSERTGPDQSLAYTPVATAFVATGWQ